MVLTWEALTEREPELIALRREIEAVKDNAPQFCANKLWYGRFKQQMMKLVGDLASRDDAVIGSSEAYDLAYQTLFHILPQCRHEGGCYWGPEREK